METEFENKLNALREEAKAKNIKLNIVFNDDVWDRCTKETVKSGADIACGDVVLRLVKEDFLRPGLIEEARELLLKLDEIRIWKAQHPDFFERLKAKILLF